MRRLAILLRTTFFDIPMRRISILSGIFLGLASLPSAAARDAFIDVPPEHPAYQAIEYLAARGVISGYGNGTFRPNNGVVRAEALKVILEPTVSESELSTYTKSSFSDVSASDWYVRYVQYAYQKKGIIQGPPTVATFNGSRPVTKAEFLKMLFLALDVNPASYGEIKLPLAFDVQNTNEWFYPYMRYAVSASVTMVSQGGVLLPSKTLTRGEMAQLLYRTMLYRDGKRTQPLLDEVQEEIEIIRYNLEKQDIQRAEFASARALLASRGAHASEPADPLVRAVVKLAEGYRAVVRAYAAGTKQDFDGVIKLCGDAWFLAEEGKKIYPGFAALKVLQDDAKELADSARVLKR